MNHRGRCTRRSIPTRFINGVGCEDVTLSLTMSTEEASTRLAVNGIQRTSQNSVVTLSGLNGQDEESDMRITLSDSTGASTTYVVHCVSSDAPVITTTARAGATEDLILFSSNDRTVDASYLLIIDNNGVPRFRRRIPEGVSHFRTHQDGKLPYSYATPWGSVPNFRGRNATSTQFVMLDNDFEPIKTVRNIPPVTHATNHDFLIKEDGGYALLSYNPVQRDLSAFNDDQGDPYSTTEGTEDSIIQEVGANGQESFRWNSWNHMAIEDCTQHRFPWDYAHINTIEDLDGDYVASLRGCSQVVRIDGETGEVIWRLGRSNRSDEDWVAGAGTPPVPIMGDPYGEFCGQHSATLLENGNLIMFDNGGHCVVDPATGESQREGGVFSRVVEYSLDRDPGTGQLVGAIFQRHHSLHSGFNRYARSQGHVEPMPNGHWLISWGQGTFDDDPNTPLPPDEAITQVNPLTGAEVLSVIVKPPDEDFIFPVRAYLLSPVALADTLGPLTAEIVESPARPVFHLGPTDAPKVVVAFNQPVVDFTAATPSLSVQGATVTSISAHNVPGEPANAYLFTLTPAGVGPITFALVADQSCASGGICTADGTPLSEVPASYAIPARHTGPVMSITSSATHPTKDGFTVTITFAEPVTGLTANEIEVTNGTGSNFSGSGAVYTLEIAPNAGIEDEVTVTVTAGAVVDALNNGNRAASAAFSVDTTPPTVSRVEISSDPGSDRTYVAEDEIRVTVTFSETVEVTGTPQLRLELGGGRRTADYGGGSGTAALVFAYEVADGESDTDGVGIEDDSLSGGTIRDEVRNNAELDHEAVAAQAGHKVDGVRPSLLSAAVDGSSLALTYGEALDGGSRPASGDFTVEVDGSGRSVTGVSISGSVVTLTLNPAVEHGDPGIRVSYSPGTDPIQDAVGNEARGLSSQSVTNTTGAQNTAPEITSPSSFDVRENQLVVRRLAARDTDAGDEVTGWEIVGGADQSEFSIASDTGELSFRAPPDFEGPGDNEYVVTVEVKSGAGTRELEAEQTFTISVTDEREPPDVPEVPAFSGETADSLTVSWTEPDNTGPDITDYDVQYREKGTGRFSDGGHQGPGLTLTLSDLNAGTVYEVRVRAANDEGTSRWSDPGEGMTVTPLTVVMASGTEPPVSGPFRVRFSFSEPVTGFGASDIETGQDPACVDDQNNTVFCDPGIGGLETADDRVFTATVTPQTDPVAHSYTLTLTVPGGAVRSSVGSKPNEEPEEPLEVRVAPPGVLEPISSLGPTASGGNGTVRLSWNRPSEDGGSAIIRYEVRYQAVGETWSEWDNVGAGSRGVTVENLINGREYVFEVRAVNGLGKGGAETVQATPERRIAPPPPPPPPPGNGGGGGGLLFPPEAPLGLMAMAGEGAVRLEWSPPESDGGAPILRYEYRLKEGRERSASGPRSRTAPRVRSTPPGIRSAGLATGPSTSLSCERSTWWARGGCRRRWRW